VIQRGDKKYKIRSYEKCNAKLAGEPERFLLLEQTSYFLALEKPGSIFGALNFKFILKKAFPFPNQARSEYDFSIALCYP
jgi:hypothetical protein